jgi:cell pole-organizing protein PopZ
MMHHMPMQPAMDDVLELDQISDIEPEPDYRLVSDPVADGASQAFAQLTGAYGMTRGLPLGKAHKSLEELVKELLRPMLKNWLDKNLNSLVERMIEREISKIAGRGEEDNESDFR